MVVVKLVRLLADVVRLGIHVESHRQDLVTRLEFSLGDGGYERGPMPMPLPIMRFLVIYMPWPKNAAWGRVSGSFNSRLQARHFHHHLSQFNA